MKRILIIDDDPVIREIIKDCLEEKEASIELASNGLEGIEMHNKQPFDVIITDIVMPEMEGIELIMKLKKSNAQAGIIAISGAGQSGPGEYLFMAKQLGVDKIHTKPLDTEKLSKDVDELLEK